MRIKLERILFATDFSQVSQQAMPYAVALARKFKAKLFVCHTLDASAPGLYDAAFLVLPARVKELAQEAEKKLRALFEDSGVEWEPVLVQGDAALGIADVADEKDVDVIIASTHGRSGLGRVLLGSVAERLLHTSKKPVLILRAQELKPGQAPDYRVEPRRILVGCDFSPDSHLAFEYALSLAQESQSEIHLLHAMEPTLYRHMDTTAGALAADLERSIESTVRSRLEALVPDDVRAWCTVKTAFVSGYAYEELTRYAKSREIDLIVLGLRGHGLLDRMLIGSTTDRVVRRAPCPVLAVQETKGSKPKQG